MSIIGRYIWLSVKKNFAYRINAVLVVFDTLMDCFTMWLFWASLLDLDIDLIGWNRDAIMIFIGYSLIASSVSNLFAGDWDIGDHIRNGTLDRILVKPFNPILLILLERANFLRFFVTFPVGLAFVLLNGMHGGILAIAFGVLLCILSTILTKLVILTVYEVSFWLKKVDNYADIIESFFSISSYPLILFGRKLLLFFTYVIPVAFTATIPTELLMGTALGWPLLLSTASSALIVLLTYLLWKMGRKRYESAN